MEGIDNIGQAESSQTGLKLNNQARGFLSEIAKWAKFLAILGFIGIGLMVLVAIFSGAILGSMPDAGGYGALSGGLLVVIYLVIAALYFFPVMYLYKFSVKMKTALARGDEDELSDAFMNLKSHYKFIGIMTIIMLSLYILFFGLAIIGGLASM